MIAEQEIICRLPPMVHADQGRQPEQVIEISIRVTIGRGPRTVLRHIPFDMLPEPWGEDLFQRFCEGINRALDFVPSGGIDVDVFHLRLSPLSEVGDLGERSRLGVAIRAITAGAVSALLAGMLVEKPEDISSAPKKQ